MRSGTPKTRVAKEFGIRRATLHDHISKKHEEKNPAKAPEIADRDDEVVDPFPNDYHIREMTSRVERIRHINRMIDDRRFYGSESIAKLSRLWRNILGKDAEKQVAEMVAEVFKRKAIERGPRELRKQFAMAELLSLYRQCRESGDNKTAATLFDKYIELDNLKEDRSLDRAVLVQIVQLIRTEVPQFAPRVEEHLAQFEIVVDRAKAVLEGEIPTSPLLPEPIPDAPPTPQSETSGIDTGAPSSEEPSSE